MNVNRVGTLNGIFGVIITYALAPSMIKVGRFEIIYSPNFLKQKKKKKITNNTKFEKF